jgi:hypothetical protein
MWMGEDDRILNSIEHAIAEKMEAGQADEARYGFAARLANATPPVDDAFQRALSVRLLVELTESTEAEKGRLTIRDRLGVIDFRRLSLVGALAAALILVLAVAAFPRLRVWQRESGTDGAARRLDPGDVDALVDRLNSEPSARAVMVFPGDYAETLAGHIRHEVVALTLNRALPMPAIHAVLGAALPPSGLVDVIMVDPETTDADRPVRTALETQLYRLYRPGETGTEMFGALERNQYVVGPDDVALEPVGVVFDNGVELVAAGVLDEPRPQEPLRLALDWRVMEPVDDSMVVFAHLICDGGRANGCGISSRSSCPGSCPRACARSRWASTAPQAASATPSPGRWRGPMWSSSAGLSEARDSAGMEICPTPCAGAGPSE